ncbi:LOW QUALITY PROTEIN: uncharacterized protein LOC124276591 [Haliotis rubra]|uniref:LOW QUALITY PROTEIN: uncharacterized protein LOC124276591 n=1 Tax=Haliotis rubra TaxID=36100 RepID=UPI001EE566C8|nr:LOW QUALITY PROTEIN: uncharacterized protein LOC124276591 [Haliotis rubra]
MPGANEIKPTDEQPFRLQWLNSCYQQTLLPDAPWHGIESKVAEVLAQRVEKQFIHAERREALLDVLGQQFVDSYLSKVKRDPQLLEPPNMLKEERQKLIVEAQSWLNSQMYRAVKDVGYQRIITGSQADDEPPPGYAEFMQHTFGVFVNGLDRQCYLQEMELAHQKQKELLNKRKGLRDAMYRLPAPSRFKPASSATSSATSKSSKPSTSQIKTMVQKVEGDPPPLWGVQSDGLGNSIVAILERDPRKFDHVAGRLHGRQLPGKLRSYMWADVLFKIERKKMKEVYVEKMIRERFAHGVTRGLSELRLKRATQSPINGLIENATIETYTKTTSMVNHKEANHMKETARALNVLYVYDRSYEPYLIHWLFPLQLAFRSPTGLLDDKGEHVFELAMYLDLLNTNCFPKWPQVFAIAEQVMNTLRQADPELHNHLTSIAKKNFKVNPKEFLVQLIHEEKSKAEALYQATPGTLRTDITATELLANPLIFFRRWIGEGFISVLDTPGVMYIWDQCFMQGWQDSVLLNTCLSLVELLRHKFMKAKDYMDMKEVFLNEPCKLYTCDIQAAWIHLENAKDLNDIPYQNRQRPVTPVKQKSACGPHPSPWSAPPLRYQGNQDTAHHPNRVCHQEPWLASVDPNHLRLFIVLYFGSVKLRSRMSLRAIEVTSFQNDAYGNAVYELLLPIEKFVFENLDLSQYDVERELGANPYATVRLEYHRPEVMHGKSPVAVGWARIPLFRQGAPSGRVSADQAWVLLAGDHTFKLHPGDTSEPFTTSMPKTPSERGEGHLIGYGCELSAVVYDPRNEPPDTPRPLPQVPPVDTRPTPRHIPRHTPNLTPRIPPRQQPPRQTPKKPTPPPVVLDPRSPSPPITETSPEPEPDVPPTPTDLEEDFEPWVEHQPKAAKTDPTPTPNDNTKPFDLYVDGVRFIPDNASIVKVTGRVLRTGELNDMSDILAIPDLESPARSPLFGYRLTVNPDSKTADPNMLVLLRVYTVDIVTERIVVVGSCLLGAFNVVGMNKGKLRIGGHQLRLRSGMPDTKNGVNTLTPASLDSAPIVPGCSLLVRLRPHSPEPVEAPKYTVGYYRSIDCHPNVSETRIFQSYEDNMKYPKTERDMVKRLQTMEGITEGRSDVSLLSWLKDRLDMKKQTPAAQPATNLSLSRCVRYRTKMGLYVKMNQAYGMPDDRVIQCFVRVTPGRKVQGMSATKEGYGKEEKFITKKHIPESFLQAPAWADDPQELHPFYDQYSCLIVQVFGLKMMYQMKPDHKAPGQLLTPEGGELDLDEESLLGWAVVPLFDGSELCAERHPPCSILKRKPTEEVLDQLSTSSAQTMLEGQRWDSSNAYETGSLKVTIWDGHYEFKEIPEMPVYENLLEKVGDITAYREAQQLKVGRHLNSIVIEALEPKYRKQGIKGAVYKKELEFFEDLLTKRFYDLMENALMTSGMGPL